jgi:hypothetical protein
MVRPSCRSTDSACSESLTVLAKDTLGRPVEVPIPIPDQHCPVFPCGFQGAKRNDITATRG